MKIILSYILFLISVISVHGQVDLRVIPDKRDLQTDEQLKLTIVLEIQGNDFNIQSPIQLPDFTKFNIIGSGSENNTDLNLRTKTLVYQVLLQPKQIGKIKIGSVLYSVNDKIYKTEPFEVYVTESAKKAVSKLDTQNDMYLNLEIKDRSIYKNQPTVAVLRAYSKNINNFRNVSDIKFPKNSGVNFHPISFKKSDIEQNPNSNLSSQIIGIFLISTPESGEINVPSLSAMVKNNSSSSTLKSNKVILKVKKLPENAPENYKNAVGHFKVSLNSSSTDENIVGQPLAVNINISGDGNFGTMDLPKLSESPDYSFFPPKIIYDTTITDKGATGTVTLKYVVIPKTNGKILLQTEAFCFFDPDKTAYENLKADRLSIVAMTQEEISDTKTTLDKVNEYTSNVMATVNTPKIISDQLKIPKVHQINYKVIVANLAILFGLALFIFSYRKKKRKKKEILIKPKIENIQEAEDRLRQEKSLDFEAELNYLKKLKNSKDFDGFFKAYEKFLEELEIFSQSNFKLSFSSFLLKNKGSKIADDFRNLNQEISIEKFAPLSNEDSI
ncbi:MAG: BatD family protein, partial [Chryseobacterium sp.]|nr:BatD family protein [Chryseobacterium sp.]